jgi:hypothetical protein
VDAAAAALLGAAIGLTGTVVAPMVTAYQGKRAKIQDLMREAYARGFLAWRRSRAGRSGYRANRRLPRREGVDSP